QMEPPVNVLLGRVVAGDWGAVYVPPCVGNSFLGRFSPADADRRLLTGNNVTLRDIYYALGKVDPRYSDLERECALVAVGLPRIRYEEMVVQFRYDSRRTIRRLVATESSLPHFLKPVRLAVAA